MSWERYYLRVIRKEEEGAIPFLWRSLLTLISLPYALATWCRNFAYDRGWFSRYIPRDIPRDISQAPFVISVGNLVAGGAGKTPVTLMLAEAFKDALPLAILSRGYRSAAARHKHAVIISRGQGPIYPAAYVGDEPYLLAERLPKASVIVGKNRCASADLATQLGAKLLLLDDGMQHRRLHRDKEVVVIDCRDPWGLGYLLPRGLLRESRRGLKRADLIILNHCEGDPEAYERLKKEISTLSAAPMVGTVGEIEGVFNLKGNRVPIQGEKVALFCGIAHPHYFAETVRSLKGEIVAEEHLVDHGHFSPDALREFSQHAALKGAKWLVCTEKDKVKLTEALETALPIAWVKMKLKIVENQAAFDTFIAHLEIGCSRVSPQNCRDFPS